MKDWAAVVSIGSNELADDIDFLCGAYPWAKKSVRDDLLFYTDYQPIRFGGLGDRFGVDLATWPLQTRDETYWTPPQDLQEHMRQVALEKRGKLRVVRPGESGLNPNFDQLPVRYPAELANREVNDTVRVAQWEATGIALEKACYLDQLATNLNPDLPVERRGGMSFRELDKGPKGLVPFQDSIQANTMGVAVLAVGRDWVPILALRGLSLDKSDEDDDDGWMDMAVMSTGWHCLSSGVLNWQDQAMAQGDDRSPLLAWLLNGMYREIEEETGITADEGLFELIPYAFARELKRAGKPQVFMLAKFNRSAQEVVDILRTKRPIHNYEYQVEELPGKRVLGIFRGKNKEKGVAVMTYPEIRLDKANDATLAKFLEDFGGTLTFEARASLIFALRSLRSNPLW